MTTTQPRLRARSLSDGDTTGRPRPADLNTFKLDAVAATTRRAAMPRSRSNMEMYSNAQQLPADSDDDDHDEDPEEAWRSIAREQYDRESIRALAQFFRSTGPPVSPSPSPENCFGMPGAPVGGESKRWSIKSLRKGARERRPASLVGFRDSTVLKTTAAGHSYMAISVPPAYGILEGRPSLHRRLSAMGSSSQRNSAPLGAAGRVPTPSSLTGSSTRYQHQSARQSRASDLAAVVHRNSSRMDRNPFRLSIRVSTQEPGVRSLMKLVDEWLDDQNPDSEAPASRRESRSSTAVTSHKAKPSAVMSVLTPVASEFEDGGRDDDASTPKIRVNAPKIVSPPPFSTIPASLPTTPPTLEPQTAAAFPDLAPRPSTSPASTKAPPDSSSRAQLSAFPSAKKPPGSPRSPTNKHRKPANIMVNRTLDVPRSTVQPDSPGFPAMLATMTFPSPPESIHSRSDSTSNSISSGLNRSVTTPPLPTTKPMARSPPPPSTLDQRVMQLSRPPLRQYNSEGATGVSIMSQQSIAASLGSYDAGSAEVGVAQAARSLPHDTSRPGASRLSKSTRRASLESDEPTDAESQRQSTASTADSSRRSTTVSDRYRHSLRSDTSATSDMTETTETYGKQRRSTNRLSTESEGVRRSETPCSTKSMSSNGTSGTGASLAERRMARRAKVREKLQRDLDASKAASLKLSKPKANVFIPNAVDSPVLGWFPQGGSRAPRPLQKTPGQGPSPLARQSSSSSSRSPHRTGEDEGTASSVHDISQLIPETVQEATSPVTPTAARPARWTFTPIMVEATEPHPHKQDEPQSPPIPTLTISPIMTVANIEARSPTATLRPLSLLTNGSSPPSVPPRSTLRPGAAASLRQRPVPIRITKNALELTVNTTPPPHKDKRNSSPHIPTPPISPDPPSSPRMSLPVAGKPTSAPPFTNRSSPAGARRAQHTRQAASALDKETRWLTAHQRQTAEQWRQAALRERMRWEREKSPDAAEKDNNTVIMTAAAAADDESNSEAERSRIPRDRHRRSTLRALNANAPPSASGDGDGDDDDDTIPQKGSGDRDEVEQRLLGALLPLLRNMNNTLQEMQQRRDGDSVSASASVSRELSAQFMDSAMALTSIGGGPEASSLSSSDAPSLEPPNAVEGQMTTS